MANGYTIGDAAKFIIKNVKFNGDECLMWPYSLNTSGYGSVYYNRAQLSASRLMCILAHGEPPIGRNESAHSCGNRRCVNPKHLSWKSKKGNSEDTVRHGRTIRGEKSARAKLKEFQVSEIIISDMPRNKLAEKFNISEKAIGHIKTGARWAHVPGKRDVPPTSYQKHEKSNAIIKDYIDGMSLNEMAEKWGIAKGSIYHHINKHGVRKRSEPNPYA